MLHVGVLALQGGVSEHLELLATLPQVQPIAIKKPKQLRGLDGLILPGGESTTIGKLLHEFELVEPILELAKLGIPLWGTCAGLILLAKQIVGESSNHLGLMDITVQRNAYGSQLASFITYENIVALSDPPIQLVFIRAPIITEYGSKVKPWIYVKDKLVAATQANILVTAFHPELTTDQRFHQYFIDMIKRN